MKNNKVFTMNAGKQNFSERLFSEAIFTNMQMLWQGKHEQGAQAYLRWSNVLKRQVYSTERCCSSMLVLQPYAAMISRIRLPRKQQTQSTTALCIMSKLGGHPSQVMSSTGVHKVCCQWYKAGYIKPRWHSLCSGAQLFVNHAPYCFAHFYTLLYHVTAI